MRKIILILVLKMLTASAIMAASQQPDGQFELYGTSVGCGPQVNEAIRLGRSEAREICLAIGQALKPLETGQPEVVHSYMRSCWAGFNSGAAILLKFKCLGYGQCEKECMDRGGDFGHCHGACGGW